jgi:hypothetical protein
MWNVTGRSESRWEVGELECRMHLTRDASLPIKMKTNENKWLGYSASRACVELIAGLTQWEFEE